MHDIINSNQWLLSRPVVKESIFEIIEEWKPILGLSHWTLNITWNKSADMAVCIAEPSYYDAKINFYLKLILEEVQTDFELEELVVHELCHCLTWPLALMADNMAREESDKLADVADQYDEQIVTALGRALVMAKYGLTSLPDGMLNRSGKVRHHKAKQKVS